MNERDEAYADVWYVIQILFWIFVVMFVAAKLGL